ncbi:hypothetical protein [Paraflavitalea speifideaquila]|uniref:hypothetical protein n=1 Tax=Paraflavitalea speifideaquila TaxID=3076558 RepID=UPI0028EB6E8F|nr:hypothetical protein [Paraflavitalea speifideiaquila]
MKLGTRFTPWAIRVGLPIKGLIRNTIFKQFVGGETLEETSRVANKLEEFGVQVILIMALKAKKERRILIMPVRSLSV